MLFTSARWMELCRVCWMRIALIMQWNSKTLQPISLETQIVHFYWGRQIQVDDISHNPWTCHLFGLQAHQTMKIINTLIVCLIYIFSIINRETCFRIPLCIVLNSFKHSNVALCSNWKFSIPFWIDIDWSLLSIFFTSIIMINHQEELLKCA